MGLGLQSHEYASSLTRTRSSYPRTRTPHASYFCRLYVGPDLGTYREPRFRGHISAHPQEQRRAACRPSHPSSHRSPDRPARHCARTRNRNPDCPDSRKLSEWRPQRSLGQRNRNRDAEISGRSRLADKADSGFARAYLARPRPKHRKQPAAPFGAALARVRALVEELAADGIRIRSIDAGGGLGIDYAAPLGAEEFDAANEVAAYAAALTEGLRGLRVRLLLEPGRFLVAQAGALVARVLYRKRNGAKEFLITDAGMNDLIRPALYGAHHEIVPLKRHVDASENAQMDVVGPVCETGDFFARDRAMPDVQPGELIALLDSGAYAMSISSNYNSRGRSAEVLVDGNKSRLVRRRETMEDQLRLEV